MLTGCGRDREQPSAPPWFEDITERTGIHFTHQVTTSGRHLFHESIGSGVAVLDFDNDGRLDLYLIHNVSPGTSATNALYHQQSDGTFRDITSGSGLDVAGLGNGLAVGDINNDGFPELLITEYDRVRLFLNEAGRRFTDITVSAGITNRHWSVPAAFLDYDRDGWLDLVIGNYLDYDPTQQCPDARGRPDFCGPHGFHSTITRLFRNLGNSSGTPRFEDVTVRSGIARVPGKAMQIVCADFDGDRWPDILVTDDGLPNRLFMNQHNGRFSEEAVVRGAAYTGMGATAANMGIALGDIDGDGLFDLFVPHLAEENHTLWRQSPRGIFQDATTTAGLLGLPWHGTGFSTVFADFDHDGALDLVVSNGGIRRRKGPARAPISPEIPAFWTPYAEPAQIFANAGNGRLFEVSGSNPALCATAIVGRGLACGDFDNNGTPDLVLTGIGNSTRILHNRSTTRHHWIGIRAIDPAVGGRDAYGAEILVTAGPRRWWRLVQPAYSYASSNDPRVQIGLGTASRVDSILIRWPDGLEEEFPNGNIDRYLTLQRGTGRRTPATP